MTADSAKSPDSLERRIVRAALDLGFVRVGIAAVERSEQAADRLQRWLAAGHHGEMEYMIGGLDRALPTTLFERACSMLVVALPYGDKAPLDLRKSASGPALPLPLTGKVARYAQGEDYHRVLKSKLERLGQAIDELVGRPVGRRACVDSAPLLERDFAVRAGLGFAAKSTLTIAPGVGSFFLLGELLLELELTPTVAEATAGCGACTRCLTACPTGAFVGPYELDARRCISYLTIELKGSVPRELRPLIGQHVFGCDICQDVCPWNQSRHTPERDPELGRHPALVDPELEELLFLTSSGYRKLVRGTALSRVSRARLGRNAAIALGNSRSPAAEAPLSRALATHSSELVRAHAAWALAALGLPLSAGRTALAHAAEHDESPEVRAEAAIALAQHDAQVARADGAMTAPDVSAR
ncbi:MAG TPA: tRNA epoxyqueuosine(34) reductase QueG [Polyangiaceae bacterium]|nr:tRNA epoxyqueuosine(34) reductase QueG [Polyangiaceae bacterium]